MASTKSARAPAQRLQIFAWSLSALVSLLAILVWGSNARWRLSHLSTYQLFPLFGLLAFSIMWSHYIVAAVRMLAKIDKQVLKTYISVTGWAVLIIIFLHPGLLTWQLWRDGFGLPPGSVLKDYVAPALGYAAVIGMVSFFVFLAYELHRWFSKRPWWAVIGYLTDLAMFAIFYHSLKLGTQLQHGWYRYVWWFYGLTLLGAIIYLYQQRLAAKV